MSTLDRLRERLALLRPRDLEAVRALFAYPSLTEADIAADLNMGLHNLRARVKHAYVVLGVETRLQLFALYHVALVGECCCSPHAGSPVRAASAMDCLGSPASATDPACKGAAR
jgi:DNA-binding CsgD family transcriptional regulator